MPTYCEHCKVIEVSSDEQYCESCINEMIDEMALEYGEGLATMVGLY